MLTMKFSRIVFVFGLILLGTSLSLAEDNKAYLAPYLNKQYVLASSDDKFDEVMETLGVGFLTRNLGKMATPVMRLTEKDGEYTLTSESVFKNIVTKFKMGEKFDDETPDGRKVESVFTQDKNKLIQVQDGDKTTTIVREFTPEEVKVTVKVDDLVSVRIYKLVN